MLAVAVTAAAEIPPKEIAAPEEWVRDDFIAYVHGLVYNDHELDTDGPTFREMFPEFDTERWSPFDELRRIARVHTDDGPVVMMEFDQPMHHTLAAVSILGWRPVSIMGSQRIVGAERHMDAPEGATYRPLTRERGINDVVVFELVDSSMRVDIVDWVDHLLGPLVDDIEVVVIAVARRGSTWYGIMGGVNDSMTPRTGVYNLTTNEFELQPVEEIAEFAVELVEVTVE